jgi:hypothetical protein
MHIRSTYAVLALGAALGAALALTGCAPSALHASFNAKREQYREQIQPRQHEQHRQPRPRMMTPWAEHV